MRFSAINYVWEHQWWQWQQWWKRRQRRQRRQRQQQWWRWERYNLNPCQQGWNFGMKLCGNITHTKRKDFRRQSCRYFLIAGCRPLQIPWLQDSVQFQFSLRIIYSVQFSSKLSFSNLISVQFSSQFCISHSVSKWSCSDIFKISSALLMTQSRR